MPKVVEIPGMGNVEFPDSMTEQQISSESARLYAEKSHDPAVVNSYLEKRYPKPAEETTSVLGATGDFLKGAVVNTAKGLWGIAKRVGTPPQDVHDAVAATIGGPLGPLLMDIGRSHVETAKKAVTASREGDLLSAAGYGLAAALPGVGPAAAATGEKIGSGHVAEGLGEAAAMTALPAAAGKVKGIKVVPKVTNPNALEAAAFDYLQGKGVPVPVGLRTGSKYVEGLQAYADTSPIGAVVEYGAKKKTTQALRATADELMDEAHPSPVVPEQSGQGIRQGLGRKITGLKAQEDAAYEGFRRIEGLPRNKKTVQVGTEPNPDFDALSVSLSGKKFAKLPEADQAAVRSVAQKTGVSETLPITQEMQLPVDMRPIKQSLQPIYERMQQWMEPAKRNANKGFTAIKSIVEGPDYMPASVAEEGLGGLKSLAREATSADLRDVNQGLAANAAKQLQDTIDATVQGAGGGALGALRMGRAKHATKMEVAEVLDEINKEPVQAFGQATWAKDAGIGLLRKVQEHAPQEMPKLGRAYLEDVFKRATEEGGFGKTGSIATRWENLGPETKKILYPDADLRANLDKFFLGAKRLGEEFNPSRSGVVALIAGHSGGAVAAIVTNPLAGSAYILGSGALSKILHSARGAKLLADGMRVPLGWRAAAAIKAGQIIRLAGDDAKPYPLAAQNVQSRSQSSDQEAR